MHQLTALVTAAAPMIAFVIIATTVFLMYLISTYKVKRDSSKSRRDLLGKLKNQPQSGFWINCQKHGDVPLTQDEYSKQCTAEKYRCPACGLIPRKIWKT